MNYRVLTLSLFGIAPVQATIAYSPITNLECKVQSSRTSSIGRVERDNGLALVEIRENEHNVFIRISSVIEAVNDMAVVNSPGGSPSNSWVGKDLNTDSKWDITTVYTSRGSKLESRIIINRLTGTLMITSRADLADGWFKVSASGSCEKSSGQRKF